MVIKVTLTEEHLKLIPFLFVQELTEKEVGISHDQLFNIGSHLLEDIALILGLVDKAIPNTKNSPDGMAFPQDIEDYMLQLYQYLIDNLYYIETIIHQFACNGGLKVGTYKALSNEMIWHMEK